MLNKNARCKSIYFFFPDTSDVVSLVFLNIHCPCIVHKFMEHSFFLFFLVSWSRMEMSGASALPWWILYLIVPVFGEGIPMDFALDLEHGLRARNFEANTSDGGSTINIHITDHPEGHILLIDPEDLLPETPNATLNASTSSVPNKSCDCLEMPVNKEINQMEKRIDEISSKVMTLETKLERHMIHDFKNSPNVFFTPPKMLKPGDENFRGQRVPNRVELMIPITESPIFPSTPFLKNLFAIDTTKTSTTTVKPKVDLLDRSKRRIDRNQLINVKKPKSMPICRRQLPIENSKRKAKPESSGSHRRTKRTRRDVSTNGNRLKRDVTMSEWLRAMYDYQKHLGEMKNLQIKTWLTNNVKRDNVKVNDVQVFYNDGDSLGSLKSFYRGIDGVLPSLGASGDKITLNSGDFEDNDASMKKHDQEGLLRSFKIE